MIKSEQGPFAYFHTGTSPWGCHLGNHIVDKMKGAMLWGQKMDSLKSEKEKKGKVPSIVLSFSLTPSQQRYTASISAPKEIPL